MKIELKTYGKIKDLIADQSYNLSGNKVKDLVDELRNKYPQLPEMIYSIAVNNVVVNENETLQFNDEVCLLPPFAGG